MPHDELPTRDPQQLGGRAGRGVPAGSGNGGALVGRRALHGSRCLLARAALLTIARRLEGGVALEGRAQVSRALNASALGTDDWRLGIEYFAELGNTRDIPGLSDQAHQIGPVVKIGWTGGYFIQSAVRFGITEGADDAMAKLFVGREF